MVKVVTQALLFSGVTAFSSLSADLESRLKPPSGSYTYLHKITIKSILEINFVVTDYDSAYKN